MTDICYHTLSIRYTIQATNNQLLFSCLCIHANFLNIRKNFDFINFFYLNFHNVITNVLLFIFHNLRYVAFLPLFFIYKQYYAFKK